MINSMKPDINIGRIARASAYVSAELSGHQAGTRQIINSISQVPSFLTGGITQIATAALPKETANPDGPVLPSAMARAVPFPKLDL